MFFKPTHPYQDAVDEARERARIANGQKSSAPEEVHISDSEPPVEKSDLFAMLISGILVVGLPIMLAIGVIIGVTVLFFT